MLATSLPGRCMACIHSHPDADAGVPSVDGPRFVMTLISLVSSSINGFPKHNDDGGRRLAMRCSNLYGVDPVIQMVQQRRRHHHPHLHTVSNTHQPITSPYRVDRCWRHVGFPHLHIACVRLGSLLVNPATTLLARRVACSSGEKARRGRRMGAEDGVMERVVCNAQLNFRVKYTWTFSFAKLDYQSIR